MPIVSTDDIPFLGEDHTSCPSAEVMWLRDPVRSVVSLTTHLTDEGISQVVFYLHPVGGYIEPNRVWLYPVSRMSSRRRQLLKQSAKKRVVANMDRTCRKQPSRSTGSTDRTVVRHRQTRGICRVHLYKLGV